MPAHLSPAWRLLVSATLVAVAALAVLPVGAAVGPSASQISARKPNVVLIVVDDQHEETLDAMPILRQRIAKRGVDLTNGIIPTSLCCPSRATLLSGRYARSTGIYSNIGPRGGWPAFHSSGAEARTIAVSLDRAGYRTAMIGKYLNGLALAEPGYVPPGWDTFRAIFDPSSRPELAAGAYYDYDLIGTGPTVRYGRRPSDYSTDVLGRLAVRFVRSTPAGEPLFLYFAPTGAHAPFTPAPRDVGMWHREPLDPAVTQLTRNRPAFWPDRRLDRQMVRKKVRRQHEALMSVDDQVGAIIEALGPRRVANTLFVYLSDNGIQLGEHGLMVKNVPYSGSTDVPMLLRWDGHLPAGSRDQRLATNADLTATIADAAGVSLADPDGVSLLGNRRRSGVVLEAQSDPQHPSYCGVRTRRYTFVEYDDDRGAELYDHARDPHELRNQVDRAGYARRAAALRRTAIRRCSPTPPGFDW